VAEDHRVVGGLLLLAQRRLVVDPRADLELLVDPLGTANDAHGLRPLGDGVLHGEVEVVVLLVARAVDKVPFGAAEDVLGWVAHRTALSRLNGCHTVVKSSSSGRKL
jgi:hypothetical protein